MQIRGLHHVTLISSNLDVTSSFYRDILGLSLVAKDVNQDDRGARHFYFGDSEGTPGTLITFLEYPAMAKGQVGVGSTHHIAMSVESEEELKAWRGYLDSQGVNCTDIIDRGFFKSLYFNDPDGHILELATAEFKGRPEY